MFIKILISDQVTSRPRDPLFIFLNGDITLKAQRNFVESQLANGHIRGEPRTTFPFGQHISNLYSREVPGALYKSTLCNSPQSTGALNRGWPRMRLIDRGIITWDPHPPPPIVSWYCVYVLYIETVHVNGHCSFDHFPRVIFHRLAV